MSCDVFMRVEDAEVADDRPETEVYVPAWAQQGILPCLRAKFD